MKELEYRKRPILLYVLLLTMAVMVMAMLRNCSSPTWHVNDRRAGGDTLNVAIEISPIGLSTRGDTLSGYYYDMIRLLAAWHNRPLKIDGFSNLEDVLIQLEKGRYDIVMGDIPASADLHERFLTTNAVLIDRQVLVQRRDTSGLMRHQEHISIIGDTIHIPYNQPFKSRIEHLTRELGDTIYIVEHHDLGAEQLIILVALGKLPNVVVNSRLAQNMAEFYPDIDSSVEISFNQFQSWIVNRRDSMLRDTLNLWIDEFENAPAASRLKSLYL